MPQSSERKDALRQAGADNFNNRLRSYKGWRLKGARLLKAASIIFAKSWKAREQLDKILEHTSHFEAEAGSPEAEIIELSQMHKEASMLLALGFENLLKGLWVGQNKEEVKAADKLPKQIHKHNLVYLARRTGIVLTAEEKKALQTLYAHSIWRGKYSLPKDKEELGDWWSGEWRGEEVHSAYLMQNYPGKLRWPDEIETLLDKILERFDGLSEESE